MMFKVELTSAWAVELQKMTTTQLIFAKKAINDILFEGQMGTLLRHSVVNNAPISRTSTPVSDISLGHSSAQYSIHDSGSGNVITDYSTTQASSPSQYFSNFQ